MTKREQLASALKSIQQKQAEFKGKEMPRNEGDALDALIAEAKGLQDQVEAEERREAELKGLTDFMGSRGAEPFVPGDDQPTSRKDDDRIVGFITPGALVSASKGLREFLAAGRPKNAHALSDIPAPIRSKFRGFVPLTGKQVRELKAVPTIGANVIEPMRLDDIARDEEQAQLQIRDVIGTGTTTQAAVRYIRSTYTRGAAAVAQGALKPEAALAMESLLATVRKVAVWLPVDDEQLADLPELSRIIDEELLYDLGKLIEELIMYGSGTGEEFLGICNDPDVPLARTEGGDTLIDIARRMITDVRIARYQPNGIAVHPLDWEDIVLEKGSDNRYVWVVVSEGDTQRLWGVPVIETVATEDFQGNLVEERNMVCGDWRRGATLWDREQASVQVGYVNDQFTKNQRTILAEARLAFAVRRPLAFVRHVTQVLDVS